jgi:hypothetical protein
LFNLPESLTARDRTANTFEKNLSRTRPRSDTPLTLPVPGELEEIQHHRELMHSAPMTAAVEDEAEQREASQEPLSEFQETLVELASRLHDGLPTEGLASAAPVQTEHEGAVYVQERLARFLKPTPSQ